MVYVFCISCQLQKCPKFGKLLQFLNDYRRLQNCLINVLGRIANHASINYLMIDTNINKYNYKIILFEYIKSFVDFLLLTTLCLDNFFLSHYIFKIVYFTCTSVYINYFQNSIRKDIIYCLILFNKENLRLHLKLVCLVKFSTFQLKHVCNEVDKTTSKYCKYDKYYNNLLC